MTLALSDGPIWGRAMSATILYDCAVEIEPDLGALMRVLQPLDVASGLLLVSLNVVTEEEAWRVGLGISGGSAALELFCARLAKMPCVFDVRWGLAKPRRMDG